MNEAEILRMYKGAEHIIQLVAPTGEFDQSSLPRAVLAVEYCENGTIGGFIRRLQGSNIQLPNRMLWAMFLCRKSPQDLGVSDVWLTTV